MSGAIGWELRSLEMLLRNGLAMLDCSMFCKGLWRRSSQSWTVEK